MTDLTEIASPALRRLERNQTETAPTVDPDRPPQLFLVFAPDTVGLGDACHAELQRYLAEEDTQLQLNPIGEDQLDQLDALRHDDILVTMEVTEQEAGNQFIRYFLSFLSLFFGYGACKLAAEFRLQTADGDDTFPLKAQQGMGVFGGTEDALMKANVKRIAGLFAKRLTRHLTHRKFHNVQVYDLAKVSLYLSLAGIIPGIGFFLILPSIVCTAISLHYIFHRRLPKRRVMAGLAAFFTVVQFVSVVLMALTMAGVFD